MNYVMQPIAAHETPPVQHEANRRCERCASKVSRYTGESRDGDFTALVCNPCQRKRLLSDIPLRRFVPKKAGVLTRGRKAGVLLPGLGPLMHRRKLTATELSEWSGVSVHHVSSLRRNANNASEECAEVLARTLGVEPDELRTA